MKDLQVVAAMREPVVVARPRGHVLEVQGLGKTYGEGAAAKEVLRGIEFRVEPGELVCIVGPSGAAKPPLVRCPGVLQGAGAGTVSVGARVLTEPPAEIGLVFQD